MKRILEHLLLLPLVVILQTIVLPGVPLCDPGVIYVLHLALAAGLMEGWILTAIAGIAMDGVSGVPAGIYLMSYLWLFGGIRWVCQFLKAGSPLFVIFSVVAGVLIENGFVILVLLFGGHPVGHAGLETLPAQLLSGATLAIPVQALMLKLGGWLFVSWDAGGDETSGEGGH